MRARGHEPAPFCQFILKQAPTQMTVLCASEPLLRMESCCLGVTGICESDLAPETDVRGL